jgi:succinoglycan biosynthesis protein ExoA
MGAAEQHPDVSVLVPVLDEAAHIREAVESMRAQRFDGQLEFLFADGGSTDGTRQFLEEMAREDPRMRLLDNPGRHTPHGLNVALAHARGEYVVRMDAHSWFPPEYVAHGVERLRRGDADWVSGPPIPRSGARWGRRVALALTGPLGGGGSSKWATDGLPRTGEIALDAGVFAGVWRRELLERYGGWSESAPVAEDAELAARFLADGRRIVCLAEMGAYYAPRESLAALARQYFRFGYFRTRTAARHAHAMRRSHVAAAGLALLPVVALGGSGPLARRARAALALYAVGLVAESAREARDAPLSDALALPAVYAVMHLSWGYGALTAFVRGGPPWAAIARAIGGRGPSSPR